MVEARILKNTKFYALLIVLVLAGALCLSSVISLLMIRVSIRTSGQIPSENVIAESGSARDIQAAVDSVVAHGGVGNVYIPEGTFNFVEVGESWTGARVVIPAGVNLFGEPTERDANGQVIEWKTILRLPWDVPGSWEGGPGTPPRNGGPITPLWFDIVGTNDPLEKTRFSDIKLQGYSSIDPDSVMILKVRIRDVIDYRIDHCCFEGIRGGLWIDDSCGVIDHCRLTNPNYYIVPWYSDCTVGYAIAPGGDEGYWETDISKILGKYLNYTCFVEDCYFSKWRYAVAGGTGTHYVARYNEIDDDPVYAAFDAHGRAQPRGTRCIEIYNNTIHNNCEPGWSGLINKVRGGAGVAFNNYVDDTMDDFIYLANEDQDNPFCWVNDWWIWNNTLESGVNFMLNGNPTQIIEGTHYHLHAPHTFNYQPYPYPHPLTLEEIPYIQKTLPRARLPYVHTIFSFGCVCLDEQQQELCRFFFL